MGSPDFPPDEAPNRYQDPSSTITFPQNNHGASEDSDNNDQGDSAYSGYQQLSTIDGENFTAAGNSSDDEEEDGTPTNELPPDMNDIELCGSGGSAFPDVTPIDVEIQQEIWKLPRPAELLNIELDEQRTNQILNVMSGISLPDAAIPPWAQNVSEDKWKTELLEKIRQKNK